MDIANMEYSERLECAYCHLDEKIETDGTTSYNHIAYVVETISDIYEIDERDLWYYYGTTY